MDKHGRIIRDHYFGPLPNLSPSEYIRRWDTAFALGVSSAAFAFVLGSFAVWRPLPVLGYVSHDALFHLSEMGKAFMWWFSGHKYFDVDAPQYLSLLESGGWATWGRLLLLGGLTALAGSWAFLRSLVPVNGIEHIAGNRLWRGKEAEIRAGLDARDLDGGPTEKEGWMPIHPCAWWGPEQWSRTMLVSGGVGSGKSQILLGIVKEIFKRNIKCISYEPKGDQVASFTRGTILSPFDERSTKPWKHKGGAIWWISKDIRDPDQAMIFAGTFIPSGEGGSDKFWVVASQMLTEGVIRHLQKTKPLRWTFGDLSAGLAQDSEMLAKMMVDSYTKAANLVADGESTTTSSVLATLASHTRMIDQLAAAWPDYVEGHMLSLTDWVSDDYKGKHRQIFLTAGKNPQLTSAYVAAMINVLAPEFLSGSMVDNKFLPKNKQRHIFMLLDELTSLGKMPIQDLIERGRSKGLKICLFFQSYEQMKKVYGQHVAQSQKDMVGTRIYCKTGPGESRDAMVQEIGKRRIKVTKMNHSYSGGQKNTSVSIEETMEDIVMASDLTDGLGPVKPWRWKWKGWKFVREQVFLGNKAILRTGGDLYELMFPPITLPERRKGLIEAQWYLDEQMGLPVSGLRPEPMSLKDELEQIGEEVKAEDERRAKQPMMHAGEFPPARAVDTPFPPAPDAGTSTSSPSGFPNAPRQPIATGNAARVLSTLEREKIGGVGVAGAVEALIRQNQNKSSMDMSSGLAALQKGSVPHHTQARK